jgi:hypothetical protein
MNSAYSFAFTQDNNNYINSPSMLYFLKYKKKNSGVLNYYFEIEKL